MLNLRFYKNNRKQIYVTASQPPRGFHPGWQAQRTQAFRTHRIAQEARPMERGRPYHRPTQDQAGSLIIIGWPAVSSAARDQVVVRLQKFLADAGVASRRAGEQFILAGR